MAEERHPRTNGASPSEADTQRRQAGEAQAIPPGTDAGSAVRELETQIDQLRRAGLELEDSCARYRELFDHAPVGYVTIGDSGAVTDANVAAARLLGAEPQHIVGRPFRAFVFAEDREIYDSLSRLPEEAGMPRSFKLRLQRGAEETSDTAGAGFFWASVECRRRQAAEGECAWVTFTDVTEGRRERLRLAYITKAVDSSGEAIGVSDAEGHHIFQNQAMSDLFGYATAEELEAAGGGQAVVRDPEVAKEMFDSIKSGMFWAGELEMVTKDGRVFPAFERADAIRDDTGSIIGLIGIITDITDRRRAEQELRERERWLSESQRVAGLGHYIFDIENDHWTGSAVLNEVLGVDEDHDTHLSAWVSVIHPAERELVSKYLAEHVLRDREPFDTEYRIIRPSDGAERWLHGLGNVEYAEDGHPVAMFGTTQDITERKVTEEKLDRERELLAQAESIGHIGSWRVGLRGGERSWSDEAVHILGFVPSTIGSDDFAALREAVHPEHRGVFEEWLKAATASAEPIRADFRILRPDGEVRWVCAHGAMEVDDEDGSPLFAGVLHDVTDSKTIEEERLGNLEQAANADRLTGLHNLRGFELLAEQAMAQARRANQGVGLIFCDVDALKAINDEFGHAQGDRALQDVASVLTFTLRSADAIARIGGDEFIVLATGGERSAVERLNERLQEGFDFFNATTARPYRISLSSGIAWSEPGETPVFERLKAAADRAMYAEKLRRRGGAG